MAYGFEKEIIDTINDNFPDGVEPLELMEKMPHLPLIFWHAARTCFIDTDEETEKYNKICENVECDRAINSDHVTNGEVVVRSSYVKDGSYVFDSTSVSNSHYVYFSSRVENCDEVKLSNDVSDCTFVMNSTNVRDSVEICESDFINWSKNIMFGRNINDSQFIYKSNDLVDCYFSGFLRNCKHCMFCSNLEDAEYYIFNKQVGRDTFETWKESLMFMLSDEDEFSSFITVRADEKINAYRRYAYSLRFDSVFNGLSEDFYGWISNLPNYSDEKFLNLFFKEWKFENS